MLEKEAETIDMLEGQARKDKQKYDAGSLESNTLYLIFIWGV